MDGIYHSLLSVTLHGGNRFGRILSIGASMMVSFAIFFGIVQVQKTKTVHNMLTFDEIETVILPSPPMPPPRFEKAEDPPPPSLMNMQPNASEATIEIAYSPETTFRAIKPQADMQISLDIAAFKPSVENVKSKRVYRKHEVDQAPIAVYKKIPKLDVKMLDKVDFRRVAIMYIVNTDGTVENVNLLGSSEPEFDRIVMDAAKKWRFKPAIKDGEKVRCWIRQGITVSIGSSSRFDVR